MPERLLLKVQEHQFNTINKNCKLPEIKHIQHIFTEDHSLQNCKIHLAQELEINDHAQQRYLIEQIIKQKQVNAYFLNKVIFIYKVYFHLDDFIDDHNCHIWDLKNNLKNKCIFNSFDANFGLARSLDHINSKMKLFKQ